MSDLIAFLSARLDEDEHAARLATEVHGVDDWTDLVLGLEVEGADINVAIPHLSRHSPARVLREIEIRRARLRRYLEQPSWHLPEGVRDTDERQRAQIVKDVLEGEVREDATVYSDHPGYRQEWKP